MPINPEKEKQKARAFVDNIIINKLKDLPEGIETNELIRQVVIQFAVTPFTMKKFLQEYYIDLKYCKEEDGILYAGKKIVEH